MHAGTWNGAWSNTANNQPTSTATQPGFGSGFGNGMSAFSATPSSSAPQWPSGGSFSGAQTTAPFGGGLGVNNEIKTANGSLSGFGNTGPGGFSAFGGGGSGGGTTATVTGNGFGGGDNLFAANNGSGQTSSGLFVNNSANNNSSFGTSTNLFGGGPGGPGAPLSTSAFGIHGGSSSGTGAFSVNNNGPSATGAFGQPAAFGLSGFAGTGVIGGASNNNTQPGGTGNWMTNAFGANVANNNTNNNGSIGGGLNAPTSIFGGTNNGTVSTPGGSGGIGLFSNVFGNASGTTATTNTNVNNNNNNNGLFGTFLGNNNANNTGIGANNSNNNPTFSTLWPQQQPPSFGITPSPYGTTSVPYTTTTKDDESFRSITAMNAYKDKSFEELCLEDMTKKPITVAASVPSLMGVNPLQAQLQPQQPQPQQQQQQQQSQFRFDAAPDNKQGLSSWLTPLQGSNAPLSLFSSSSATPTPIQQQQQQQPLPFAPSTTSSLFPLSSNNISQAQQQTQQPLFNQSSFGQQATPFGQASSLFAQTTTVPSPVTLPSQASASLFPPHKNDNPFMQQNSSQQQQQPQFTQQPPWLQNFPVGQALQQQQQQQQPPQQQQQQSQQPQQQNPWPQSFVVGQQGIGVPNGGYVSAPENAWVPSGASAPSPFQIQPPQQVAPEATKVVATVDGDPFLLAQVTPNNNIGQQGTDNLISATISSDPFFLSGMTAGSIPSTAQQRDIFHHDQMHDQQQQPRQLRNRVNGNNNNGNDYYNSSSSGDNEADKYNSANDSEKHKPKRPTMWTPLGHDSRIRARCYGGRGVHASMTVLPPSFVLGRRIASFAQAMCEHKRASCSSLLSSIPDDFYSRRRLRRISPPPLVVIPRPRGNSAGNYDHTHNNNSNTDTTYTDNGSGTNNATVVSSADDCDIRNRNSRELPTSHEVKSRVRYDFLDDSSADNNGTHHRRHEDATATNKKEHKRNEADMLLVPSAAHRSFSLFPNNDDDDDNDDADDNEDLFTCVGGTFSDLSHGESKGAERVEMKSGRSSSRMINDANNGHRSAANAPVVNFASIDGETQCAFNEEIKKSKEKKTKTARCHVAKKKHNKTAHGSIVQKKHDCSAKKNTKSHQITHLQRENGADWNDQSHSRSRSPSRSCSGRSLRHSENSDDSEVVPLLDTDGECSADHAKNNKNDSNSNKDSTECTGPPRLTHPKYFTIPDMADLCHWNDEQLKKVHGFTVGHCENGYIEWEHAVDVRGVDLDSVIRFIPRSCELYETCEPPPRGVGLNNAATVTLYNCWPKKQRQQQQKQEQHSPSSFTDDSVTDLSRYRQDLCTLCASMGAHHIDYDPASGDWTFGIDGV